MTHDEKWLYNHYVAQLKDLKFFIVFLGVIGTSLIAVYTIQPTRVSTIEYVCLAVIGGCVAALYGYKRFILSSLKELKESD